MTMVNSVTDSVLFWSKLSISAWLLCIFQMAKCLAQYLATILPSQRRMRGVRRHNSLWRVVVMEYDLVFEV